ncbi:L,D-transpeptidase [Falsochrobactrum sp. TDYN1]|uniref:L,D-transpeptidase n=1 Tax=Falsochrobactrum tianjinense TaxID=2706015 RepID=A0A949PMR7_9HYPH|nr:L,D-transpeptidase [Falsochrobactrum sp. TDYN1]MBV2144186.1 L,D-transpeptidase [Falsochrobactrum sp. TDYN1]
MPDKFPDDKKTPLLRRSVASRRAFLIGASAIALSGCVTATPPTRPTKTVAKAKPARPVPLMYQAMPEEQFPLPAVDVSKVDPKFWRQEVDYPTNEAPGTVIVDTPNKFLYHVRGNGRAMRYGIGVGRDGFSWAGRAKIAYKRQWPRWTPPDEMVARQPSLEPYSIANGGMPPSLKNPLGARAMYIHKDRRDTLYRIHGSPEEWSIGKAVSSGCIRLLNQDIIDLYNNVRDGSTLVVIPDPTKGQQAVTA